MFKRPCVTLQRGKLKWHGARSVEPFEKGETFFFLLLGDQFRGTE
jgi:hypothetical protein